MPVRAPARDANRGVSAIATLVFNSIDELLLVGSTHRQQW
jgi:hypothetical protein